MIQTNQSIALVKMTEGDVTRITPIVTEAFEKATLEIFGEEKAKMQSQMIDDDALRQSAFDNKTDAYIIVIDGNESGIAVLKEFGKNAYSLELLSISPQHQSKGTGLLVWNKIEELYPNAEVFETTTPTFATRNVNFYVNKCKFHIVEMLDMEKIARETGEENPFAGDEHFRFNFRFQKKMEISK